MKILKTLATVVLCATLFTGCVNANKDAVITINEEPITKAEFDQTMDEVTKNSMVSKIGIDLKKDPNSVLYLTLKDRVVNELIIKNLLEQDIKNKKIKVTQDDVDAELKKIIDQIGDKNKFNELLKQNGVTAAQFKKDLEDQVKIKKLVEGLKDVDISDKDAEKFYKQNLDKFKHPERVKASHILVSANKDEIKALLASKPENKALTDAELEGKVKTELSLKYDRAKKLLDEVKRDPTSFAKVAKENSDDPGSAVNGGDLGYFAKEQMVDSFSNAAFSQKPSTISNIVVSPYGYHIIMVTDRQEAGVDKFDKVKNDIKEFLTMQERVNVLQRHVEKLKNEASIVFVDPSYNPEAIRKAIEEKAAQRAEMKQALPVVKD